MDVLIQVLIVLGCLAGGFLLGLLFMWICRARSLHRKTIRQYTYSEKDQVMKMMSDKEFLQPKHKEHASTDFR